MTSALLARVRRLERARKPKGEVLALFLRAVDAIMGASGDLALAAVKAIPRKRLRLFAGGIHDRISDARELARIDEAEDGPD